MARSIPDLLRERVRATPDAEALRHRVDGRWRSTTWREVGDLVRGQALGFRRLGVRDGARVALMAQTSVEWVLADLAVLAAGGVTTTIYPSSTREEAAHVLRDSGAVLVVADPDFVGSVGDVRVVTTDNLPFADEGDYDAMVDALAPEDLATLIYTSGTTGVPKGVELTHDNWLYTAEAVAELGVLRSDDLHFLWLPMSHSFGKVLQIAMIATGVTTAVDGSADRIAENLAELRPTIVAGAPRVFEKIHSRVGAAMRAEGGVKEKLFRWAQEVAQHPEWTLRNKVADRLVFAKLRDRVGGRIRYFVSGSAPLSPEVGRFFAGAGIPILEGYGLTESSAASFLNRPGEQEFGTVGKPLPGTEVRIADDGEVLIGGRGVMRGYHNLPEETEAALDGGWLRTGDIGELDDAGRLRITDRKKELIKTSAGKYVAPQSVESKLKAASPYIGHVLVHGDQRNYCVALVTLDPDTAPPGLDADAEIRSAVDTANASLARHETIKKFAVLDQEFTVADGTLTSSMKMRRKEIESRYRDVLDGLYAG
ncbi:AMP-dependent synthetase/ligase [Actinosynnema sp. NPDC047251]|uniref:AMP-dependent synthetase and ligase n=1 Tax=Saccharothrix espanaensis (strain ATCC 51144 / DSM 44229 / JCM 9112 / NBRC 15066 / NRRL 15764) TaxID=1179773 RepID=K0K7Z0_SACES|nr:AMP-dependent synthetase/ligase [Saccharothrix espanaensis]CCH33627.1 AMP-dependent synthetase and ligase [Saccharothrix espanaensis DSM 44229]